MSVELMAVCWKKKFDNHADKDVMVALCDHANDEGICWPSRAYIAWKIDRHPDTVKDALKKFKQQGIIETRREANNDLSKSPVIRVLPHKLPDKAAYGDRGVSDPPGGGVSDPPDRGVPDPPKPSLEPSVEPSSSPKASDEAPRDRITVLVDRCREVDFEPTKTQKKTWAAELMAKNRVELEQRDFMLLVNRIAQAAADGYFWSLSRAERELGEPRGKTSIGSNVVSINGQYDPEKAKAERVADRLRQMQEVFGKGAS